ncbi:hypothetical protein [Anaerosalibacter massiliensis]|uniref:Uncharacterized protein n=1 Tax=Anaerosalibacter massiliensis TaxID=1347392 RepID=A0A9X2S8E3_9FIRM|nr:hypothetical protein [Anaerosalibacter massiliensis]MCR2045031.1 hypothetical protein [Anaerosalibacter massiliensis]
MNLDKKISISQFQIKLFTMLLTIVWLGIGIYTLFKYDYKIGVPMIIFSSMFLIVFKLIQKYSTKMLKIYNNNLENKGGK